MALQECFRKSYFTIVRAMVKCTLLSPHKGVTSYSDQCSYLPSAKIPPEIFWCYWADLLSWVLSCQSSGRESLKSFCTDKSKCLTVITPSFYYINLFSWDFSSWGGKTTRDFFHAVSINYCIGFISWFSCGFALFTWSSEKVLLCQVYLIYLIHLGCLNAMQIESCESAGKF